MISEQIALAAMFRFHNVSIFHKFLFSADILKSVPEWFLLKTCKNNIPGAELQTFLVDTIPYYVFD